MATHFHAQLDLSTETLRIKFPILSPSFIARWSAWRCTCWCSPARRRWCCPWAWRSPNCRRIPCAAWAGTRTTSWASSARWPGLLLIVNKLLNIIQLITIKPRSGGRRSSRAAGWRTSWTRAGRARRRWGGPPTAATSTPGRRRTRSAAANITKVGLDFCRRLSRKVGYVAVQEV